MEELAAKSVEAAARVVQALGPVDRPHWDETTRKVYYLACNVLIQTFQKLTERK